MSFAGKQHANNGAKQTSFQTKVDNVSTQDKTATPVKDLYDMVGNAGYIRLNRVQGKGSAARREHGESDMVEGDMPPIPPEVLTHPKAKHKRFILKILNADFKKNPSDEAGMAEFQVWLRAVQELDAAAFEAYLNTFDRKSTEHGIAKKARQVLGEL